MTEAEIDRRWALPTVSARDALGIGLNGTNRGQVSELEVERAVGWLAWLDASHAGGFAPDNLNNQIAKAAVGFYAKYGIVIEKGTVPTRAFVARCVAALEAVGVEPELITNLHEHYGLAKGWSHFPVSNDVLFESSPADDVEVAALASQVAAGDYAVPDQRVTAKTRGSAQRVFADRVKRNYGWTCALTGIATRDFLVASHIVPWSDDESIRLDPANGICLSTFVDRAFDTGYLAIHEDCCVHINWSRVGADQTLREALALFDGQKLTLPATSPPNPEFLGRRLLLQSVPDVG